MNRQGDIAQGDIIGTIIGLFVSILIIWVFWQVLSQLNFWFGVLFIIIAILVIVGAVSRR